MGRFKSVVLALVLALMIAGTASAGIPVIENGIVSKLTALIQSYQVEFQEWIKDVMTNVKNIMAVKDLANFATKFADQLKNFDAKGLLDGMVGDLKVDSMFNFEDGLRDFTKSSNFKLDFQGADKFSESLRDAIEKATKSGTERAKEGSSNTAKSPDFRNKASERAKESGSTMSGSDISSTATAAADSMAAGTEAIAKTVPMSMPGMAEGVVEQTIANLKMDNDRLGAYISASREAKTYPLAEFARFAAKYDEQENKSYRNVSNKVMENHAEIIAKAKQLANGGEGDALPVIAGLAAIQAELLANQNAILVEQIDVMADEIRVLTRIGAVNTEAMSAAVLGNMKEIDSYFTTQIRHFSQ